MKTAETRRIVIAVLVSLGFMGVIAGAASASGVALLLFPELAALSYDVFLRPRGTWASAPWMLAISPALAAVLGICVTRYLPYSGVSIVICIVGTMLLLKLIRSPIVPAISACFLALALGETSWLYPLAILCGTSSLAILGSINRRIYVGDAQPVVASAVDQIDDQIETLPTQYAWVPAFALFLTIAYLVSLGSGMKMVLFPPVVVLAYEMFAHADVCPWAKRPLLLPAICVLAASAGVAAIAALGAGVISTVLVMLFGVVLLRATRIHAIPALAIGLLPQIMAHADWHFPLAVGIGSILLTIGFLLFQAFPIGKPHSA